MREGARRGRRLSRLVQEQHWLAWKEAAMLFHGLRLLGCFRIRTLLGGGFLESVDAAAAAKSLQSCPTLCDPIDGSPPGSPVPGILQAVTLEWVALSFSNA